MNDPDLQSNVHLHAQEILLAASQHDLTTLGHHLQSYSFPDCRSADVQDPETGFTPLHAAIAACEAEEACDPIISETSVSSSRPDQLYNGSLVLSDAATHRVEFISRAHETVRCLLEHGAIWNQLDRNDETPGCIAKRLGLQDLYELMVDAGVRAELLLNRLQGYVKLEDSDQDETEALPDGQLSGASHSSDEPIRSQVLLESEVGVNNAQYLSSTLSLDDNRILDEQSNGVMMSWESEIMSKSANALLTGPNMKVLNVGFGMGIIDTYFQSHSNQPATHHIVEAHPSVLANMKTQGWYEKPGVVVHQGKWQDILPQLVIEGHTFDAIYYDTFAESYSDFRDFFTEEVIGLLDPTGKFSFFNGLGADRQISYDVYQKVVEMDLFEAGFDINWQVVQVPELHQEWEGVRRRYWNVSEYRLPVCAYMD